MAYNLNLIILFFTHSIQSDTDVDQCTPPYDTLGLLHCLTAWGEDTIGEVVMTNRSQQTKYDTHFKKHGIACAHAQVNRSRMLEVDAITNGRQWTPHRSLEKCPVDLLASQ